MAQLLRDREILEASFALAYFGLAFMMYYFSQGAGWVMRFGKRMGDKPGKPEASVYLERIIGFVLLGLLPAAGLLLSGRRLADFGIRFPQANMLWLWILWPCLLFVGIAVFRPRGGVNLDYYPQVRKKTWHLRRLSLNTLFWLLYLLGYEFAFRGWLFFTAHRAFGLLPALAINAALYSLAHIPKGRQEAYGAFFLGILLSWIAFATGSMLIPLLVHLIIALGNDYKAVAVSETMRFNLRWHDEKTQ